MYIFIYYIYLYIIYYTYYYWTVAEENLHKYEPESKQNPEIENRSIKAEIELKELNLPEERPTYPRESSKHGSKSKSGCCIVM